MKHTNKIIAVIMFVALSAVYITRADYHVKKRTVYSNPGAYTEIGGPCAAEPNCADNCYVSEITSCSAGYLGSDGALVHFWSQKKTSTGWQQDQSFWVTNISSPMHVYASVDYPDTTYSAVRAVVQVYNSAGTVLVAQNWIQFDDCP